MTVIVCVVPPFDQAFPVAEDDVNPTDCPAQKVVGPLAVMVGDAGMAFTVTAVIAEIALHPFASVYCTA